MNLVELQTDPAEFRRHLVIDCDGESLPLADVSDKWQTKDFAALDPGWRKVIGQDCDGKLRHWLERPRGHSKSLDAMVMATWCLFSSKRQITGVVCACDRDQAKLNRNHVDRLVRLNPWLGEVIKVDQHKIANVRTGSSMEIISSDVASSYGLLIDFAVLDEVTIWPKRDLFDSVFSAAAKRKNCLLMCVGNAGFEDSWQFSLRQKIREDPKWRFSRLKKPCASWITEDRLAEQRRLLPHVAYERLWGNKWSSGSGDAISSELIDRAIDEKLESTFDPELGWRYYGGLDLGLSRDATAFVVIGRHVGHVMTRRRKGPKLTGPLAAMADLGMIENYVEDRVEETVEEGTSKVRLIRAHVWRPEGGRKVPLDDVERMIEVTARRFPGLVVAADPWQSEHMVQRLQTAGVAIDGLAFTPENIKQMCAILLEMFNEGLVELYPHAALIHDLRSLRIVEKSYGCRLESPRGPAGHGDCGTAFSLALLASRRNFGLTASDRMPIMSC